MNEPLIPALALQYSKAGVDRTKRFESCRLVAYQDSKGVWTVGWGHTRGVKGGDTCTQQQADLWLDQDLILSINNVKRHLKVPVTQNEFDSMVDFDFNLGDQNFNTSTLLKDVNDGEILMAASEFQKWDHCGGVELAGLLRRRLDEKDNFLS